VRIAVDDNADPGQRNVDCEEFAFSMKREMQSLARQRRLPPTRAALPRLRIVQHRRSTRQNMSRTSACAVLYFHVGGAGLIQLIVTVVVFYVIIRMIDGLSLVLGGRGGTEKRRDAKNHRWPF
jgi:hypothetical protein